MGWLAGEINQYIKAARSVDDLWCVARQPGHRGEGDDAAGRLSSEIAEE